jgi:hypothetical protein
MATPGCGNTAGLIPDPSKSGITVTARPATGLTTHSVPRAPASLAQPAASAGQALGGRARCRGPRGEEMRVPATGRTAVPF